MTQAISRRRFIEGGALYGGALWLTLHVPRPRAAAAAAMTGERATLSEAEWRAVEAFCARIVPKDRDPGAAEAGCVNFIDKALANEDAALVPVYHDGLAALDAVSKQRHQQDFAALDSAQQDALLVSLQDDATPEWNAKAVKAPDFFETLRVHTLIGLLADPRYGGNRDYAGWKLVGYPGPRHHAGGYSAEQMQGSDSIKAIWGEDV